jgi:uncharacterized membrane protein YcaP (DUF421 family)
MEQSHLSPNEIIEHLRQKGIKHVDIMRAMNIEKGMFNSWRNSANKKRRMEMTEELLKIYASELEDIGLSTFNEPVPPYLLKREDDKYLELLEQTVKELKVQNEWLRNLVEEKNSQIREILKKQ